MLVKRKRHAPTAYQLPTCCLAIFPMLVVVVVVVAVERYISVCQGRSKKKEKKHLSSAFPLERNEANDGAEGRETMWEGKGNFAYEMGASMREWQDHHHRRTVMLDGNRKPRAHSIGVKVQFPRHLPSIDSRRERGREGESRTCVRERNSCVVKVRNLSHFLSFLR